MRPGPLAGSGFLYDHSLNPCRIASFLVQLSFHTADASTVVTLERNLQVLGQ